LIRPVVVCRLESHNAIWPDPGTVLRLKEDLQRCCGTVFDLSLFSAEEFLHCHVSH